MKAELSAAERGYAVYNPRSLRLYDRFVLGFSNRCVWKCPTEEIIDLYREHITTNHLEVGVGTGYFLEKTLPQAETRLALLDANRDCLNYAAARLEKTRPDCPRPELHQEDLLEPFDLPGAGFDSIGVNYVFHCMPGRLDDKAGRAIDHLAPYLHEKGTLFGATILAKEISTPIAAKLFLRTYNRKGIFSNKEDSLGAVMEVLSARFRTFNVEVHGCVVLFWGKGLRDSFRQRIDRRA